MAGDGGLPVLGGLLRCEERQAGAGMCFRDLLRRPGQAELRAESSYMPEQWSVTDNGALQGSAEKAARLKLRVESHPQRQDLVFKGAAILAHIMQVQEASGYLRDLEQPAQKASE